MECELLAKETFSLMEHLRESEAQDGDQAFWDELKNDPLYQSLNPAPQETSGDGSDVTYAQVADELVSPAASKEGRGPAEVGAATADHNPWMASANYPAQPGIFYLLETTPSTFCVRALACADLAAAFTQLPQSSFGQKWNLTTPQGLHYLACDNLGHAEMIVDYLSNKRLPRDQDLIGHLADRDFHWWWQESGDQVTIYYGGHPTGEHFSKLGPLGDTRIAAVRFRHAYSFLQGLFPLAAFKADEEKVILRTADKENASFKEFRELFMAGGKINPPPSNNREVQTLGLYFAELAAVRRFWLQVQQQVALTPQETGTN